MCDHILLHHNSVDTDVETCEFNVVDTNTTLNFDSSIPAVFDSPKRTPKRTSENLPQHGEPRLYMSNDFYINSLLASNSYSCSYRDEEEKQNSLKVLGKPRCWTDSIINSDGEAESSEKGDSDGWTMLTPIRNLAQNSSTKKLPITLETLEDSNEVGYNDKFTLVDMFKNLCIAAKRVVLRGGILLYQPVSNLIQRMTKRNFSLIELRQILYICPEIVSVRWIRVNSAIKKLYPKEYSAFTSDTIFDLKISLKVNDSHCTSSTDFNKALDIFTNAINRYDEQSMHNGRKNKPDQTMDTSTIVNDGLDNETRQLNYPLGELPEKPTPNRGKLLEVLKTPTKFRNSDTCGRDTDHDDHSPSRLSSSSRLSSLRATFKLKCDHGLFTEETGRSHANIGTNTPSRLMFETPKRGVMQLTGSQTPNDKFPLGSPVSNVQLDLLDTPGMVLFLGFSLCLQCNAPH